MRLMVTGDGALVRLWADALAPVTIRHPNPTAKPAVQLVGQGDHFARLSVMVYDALCTATDEPHESSPLLVSQVQLSFFPGARLARQWIAAAWAGYLQHEALELVTVDGRIVLNPHEEPKDANPWNRGLRDGLPVVLDKLSLTKALGVVMDSDWAQILVSLGEAE